MIVMVLALTNILLITVCIYTVTDTDDAHIYLSPSIELIAQK